MSDSHVIVRTEILPPALAVALARLLDAAPPNLERDGLPLLWHWLYLLECPHQADLGADGHPVRGVIPTPPEPGRRRMWAAGRVDPAAALDTGPRGHPQVGDHLGRRQGGAIGASDLRDGPTHDHPSRGYRGGGGALTYNAHRIHYDRDYARDVEGYVTAFWSSSTMSAPGEKKLVILSRRALCENTDQERYQAAESG
ncbi:hypothetical protein Aple_023940 [Acrocarpospora pleiomorpha]|uniref:Uncharacterized protein n=1 Tax=Acrocarpospora pleiomorpha TaxID=90975 RepID=A0A5M3XMS7_9ACTN|nr:hypothetical protein [Acrocarpospora pleiomorpha]GES19498.1 hypothetical protein Aple_023940 [Acrocarpospora pleiomorpha]